MVKITYKTGDKVFAKVKGYPPWPAEVVGDTGKKKYNVLFYGTQETGAIKPEDLAYYLKYKSSYVHKYLKRSGYEDAVKQIEEAIKKDGGDGNDGTQDDSTYDIDVSDTSSISSISEKKTPKRKVSSLPADETAAKKPTSRGRRRSVATSECKEDESEEPVTKKSRRKSRASTESKEDQDTMGKSNKPSNTGTKEDILEETDENEKPDEEAEKIEAMGLKIEKQDSSAVEETTSASETEKMMKNLDLEKDKNLTRKKTEFEKPKDPEFVEIKTDKDGTMQMEDGAPEETEKNAVIAAVKVEIVTDQVLNANILYAEHVKKHPTLYKDRPVDRRQYSEDQVLPIRLPSGTICGVKLHQTWPLNHADEYESAVYDADVAKAVLEVKDQLFSGKKVPKEVELQVIPDIQMSLEDLKEIFYARDIESKRKRLNRLKKEADLVTWDSKIKNNLGLDKALPDTALEALREFGHIEKDLDALMFKKHPHVVDTVRRLRKYVGNVKEWDLTNDEIEAFNKKAEKIRNEAEKIYNKIKKVVKIPEEKGTFWDTFMELVAAFRTKCKDLSESEVLVLCAEPDSRQAFVDKLDEVTESEGASINPSNTSEAVLKETSVQGWSEKK